MSKDKKEELQFNFYEGLSRFIGQENRIEDFRNTCLIRKRELGRLRGRAPGDFKEEVLKKLAKVNENKIEIEQYTNTVTTFLKDTANMSSEAFELQLKAFNVQNQPQYKSYLRARKSSSSIITQKALFDTIDVLISRSNLYNHIELGYIYNTAAEVFKLNAAIIYANNLPEWTDKELRALFVANKDKRYADCKTAAEKEMIAIQALEKVAQIQVRIDAYERSNEEIVIEGKPVNKEEYIEGLKDLVKILRHNIKGEVKTV